MMLLSHSHFNSLLLFIFIFIFSFPSLVKPDLSADRAALLALRSSNRGETLRWNLNHTSPCTWPGVSCQGDRVTSLCLPGAHLYGPIPLGVFGKLTRLRTLSLRFNAIEGPLPLDLARCTQLRRMFLRGNRLTGELPGFLTGLDSLVKLDLAGNQFSGPLPQAFNNLTRLTTLLLEKNLFSGSLPDFNLPALVHLNVSYNQLNGSIPSKLSAMEASAFEGNRLCGGPMEACPTSKLSGGMIAIFVIGGIAEIVLIGLIPFLLCWQKRHNKNSKTVSNGNSENVELEKTGTEGTHL